MSYNEIHDALALTGVVLSLVSLGLSLYSLSKFKEAYGGYRNLWNVFWGSRHRGANSEK